MCALGFGVLLPIPTSAQIPDDPKGLYEIACASCHGENGQGRPPGSVAFTVPVPDFADCSFSSREPDADWIAVAHQGGPVRGFDETMPAFGDALSEDQLQQTIDYIRVFCGDDGWPRGELNLPRPLHTEKAYPEDEAVLTVGIDAEGSGAVINEFLYERRFGARNQIEIKMPIGLRETGPSGAWTPGLGDLAVGLKRVLYHDYRAGSILSVGGEVVLPTGDESNGFGGGSAILEPFLAFGQILPADGFVHVQAIVEIPTETGTHDNEAVWRAVIGKSWTQGRFGRTWSPMIEVLGSRDLISGASVVWDIVPQFQVTLNTRQHVMANVGVQVPLTDSGPRPTRVVLYILWDWFDGGFFSGW